MATITIRRQGESGPVYFDPSSIKLGAGDFVIWVNEDPRESHHPTMDGQPADYWMNYPLPPAVPDEPAASSPQINLAGPDPIRYVDALDSDVEAGTITF